MDHVHLRALCILSGIIAALAIALPVSAHANLVRAEPGISASVPTAPATVRLSFSEAPEPRYSDVTIFNATRERFDTGDLHVAPDDRESLIIGVRDLPQGIYTVVWKTTSAVDGHTTGGSFAFAVGAASITGSAATQSTVTFAGPTPLEVVTKWLAYLGASVFLGAMALGLFIWTPAIAVTATDGDADDALAERVNKRLAVIADSALFVLAGATALGALAQVAKATGRSLVGALNIDLLHGYLLETRTGSIWCLRLFLAFFAAILLTPTHLRIVRTPRTRETNRQLIAVLLGLAVGANELLTISLISHGAATPFATPVTVAIDWLHLLATAIWIGGLVGLAITIPMIARRTIAGPILLRAVVSRFSAMALGTVGVLVLTGLYSAWVHVGSLEALRSTDYGHAVLVKLALVLGLLLLGAFNLLWVRPRLARTGDTAQGNPATHPVIRHFRRSLGGEVLLGGAVLLVVAILTGLAPSREAATQTGQTQLTQRADAGDLTVALTPSTLQPGVITYDVFVTKGQPVRDAARVELRFASPELGADETAEVATARGDGHYTLTGPYTALAGDWQTRVIVRRTARNDVSATFTLPIGGTAIPAPAENAAKPTVTTATLIYGIGAVLLVFLFIGGAAGASRRLSVGTLRGVPTPHAASSAGDNAIGTRRG